MDTWETYALRLGDLGGTARRSSLLQEQDMLTHMIRGSLSYHHVLIDDEPRNVAIINSDNLNEKKIFSLPGESLKCGSLVEWMNNRWLITELDANAEVYTRAKLLQCNHLLKWVSADGVIHQQWSVVEDGTKYLTGEYEDRYFVATRGDSRIAVTVARNTETVKLNRQIRFLIDDPDSDFKLAYALTKPLKVGLTYNNEGVYKFVCQEVYTIDDDNLELGIADYYKYYNQDGTRIATDGQNVPGDNPDPGTDPGDNSAPGKKVWY